MRRQAGVAGARLVAVVPAHQPVDQLAADGAPLLAEVNDAADAAGGLQGDRGDHFQIHVDEQVVGEHGFTLRDPFATPQLLHFHHGVIGFDALSRQMGAGAGLFLGLAVGQIPFLHCCSVFSCCRASGYDNGGKKKGHAWRGLFYRVSDYQPFTRPPLNSSVPFL
ncbi:hypothetical protein D3C77_563830 [compost metagenome]